ncbi:hypothetical protein Pla175_23110 [Pirellulimonas nuda]|uniref:LamG-like jellyroll fold domain-containing protein n=1 Tax=Pirellulimonas nuda TaxID=2528009 RepID=A0A518DBR8_9BACT|nr:LamG domain-containing protein [Pirellulimonas nuda]QDU88927.1 hypothetical protein Pla175_23110 [Pirellulimonas nuda]
MRRNRLATVGLLNCTLFAANLSPAALLHHWAFDDGSGDTAVDSAGANNGAIVGATWATGAGDRASYLSFNGTDSRVDPALTFPSISQADSSSWAFWVNPASAQTNDIIVGNRKDGSNVDIGPGTRNFLKVTPFSRFDFHQGVAKSVTLTTFPVDEWTHFAFSRSGDQLTWYINGVAENGGLPATIPGLDAVPNGAILPFYIGGEPGQNQNEHFAGGIDDVRIYDSAISAAEVRALAGVVPEPSALHLLFAVGGFLLISGWRTREQACPNAIESLRG